MDSTAKKTVWKNKKFIQKTTEPFNGNNYSSPPSILDDFLPKKWKRSVFGKGKKDPSTEDEDELYIDMLDHDNTIDTKMFPVDNGDVVFEPLENMGGDKKGETGETVRSGGGVPQYYTFDDYTEDISYNKNEFNLLARDLEQDKIDASKNVVLENIIKKITPTRNVNDNFNKMASNFNYRTFREFVKSLVNYIPETVDYYTYYVAYKFANLYYKAESLTIEKYYEEEELWKDASGESGHADVSSSSAKERMEQEKELFKFLEKNGDLDKDARRIKRHLYSVMAIPFAMYIAYNWWFLFQSDNSYIDFAKILETVKPMHFFLESTIQPMNYLNKILLGSKTDEPMNTILGALSGLFQLKGVLMFLLFAICYFIVLTHSSYFNTTLNDVIDSKKNVLYSITFAVVVISYLSTDVFNGTRLMDMINLLKSPIFVCVALLIKFLFVMISVPLSLPIVFLYLIVFSFFGIVMNKGFSELWSTIKIIHFEIENSVKLPDDKQCFQTSMFKQILHYMNKYFFRYMLPIIIVLVGVKGFVDTTAIISQQIQLMMFFFFGGVIGCGVLYGMFV